MTPISFSLIIPTYNEAKNILLLVENVHVVLGTLPHEIIVVDDNSPDLTWKRVEDFSLTRPWVRGIRRLTDRGLSSAVLAGFDQSTGVILGVMDADLSHDEKILPRMIELVKEGADLVVGSRRVPGGGATHWPWYRRLTSNFATVVAKLFLRVSINDPMSGYFVMKRSLYEACKSRLQPTGYKILLEIYSKGRPAVVQEVPFVFKDRTQGVSKLSVGVIQQYLFMVARLFIESLRRKSS
jgi:dolichol-phosphate mannosyltransferase